MTDVSNTENEPGSGAPSVNFEKAQQTVGSGTVGLDGKKPAGARLLLAVKKILLCLAAWYVPGIVCLAIFHDPTAYQLFAFIAMIIDCAGLVLFPAIVISIAFSVTLLMHTRIWVAPLIVLLVSLAYWTFAALVLYAR